MIEPGSSASIEFTADDATTAIALGSGDVPVLGTPKVVALCEEAACAAIVGSLGSESTTVGTHIAVDHLAPTPVGRSVTATATVTAIEGRRITFELSVIDDELSVARGVHERIVVDRDRFLS